MAGMDERLTRLLGALDRAGANGIADAVRSRIQDAEIGPVGDEGDGGVDPRAPRKEEGAEERGIRQLNIANEVVEGLLLREMALVRSIGEQVALLNARSAEGDGGFAIERVAISTDGEGGGRGLRFIDEARVEALKNLHQAWHAAWSPAVEGRWRDLR